MARHWPGGQQHYSSGTPWSRTLTEPKEQTLPLLPFSVSGPGSSRSLHATPVLPASGSERVPAPSSLLPFASLSPRSRFHIHRRMLRAPEEPQLQTQQYLPGIEKLDTTTSSSSADLSSCYHLCLIIMQFLARSSLSYHLPPLPGSAPLSPSY